MEPHHHIQFSVIPSVLPLCRGCIQRILSSIDGTRFFFNHIVFLYFIFPVFLNFILFDFISFSDGVKVEPSNNSLEKIIVYVHNKLKENDDDQYAPDNMCGYVSSLNDAIFRPRLHVPCIRSLSGRYLSIEAWGKSHTFNKLFSATFCEVQVYA